MGGEGAAEAVVASCDLHRLVFNIILRLSHALLGLHIQASLRALEVFESIVRCSAY